MAKNKSLSQVLYPNPISQTGFARCRASKGSCCWLSGNFLLMPLIFFCSARLLRDHESGDKPNFCKVRNDGRVITQIEIGDCFVCAFRASTFFSLSFLNLPSAVETIFTVKL